MGHLAVRGVGGGACYPVPTAAAGGFCTPPAARERRTPDRPRRGKKNGGGAKNVPAALPGLLARRFPLERPGRLLQRGRSATAISWSASSNAGQAGNSD